MRSLTRPLRCLVIPVWHILVPGVCTAPLSQTESNLVKGFTRDSSLSRLSQNHCSELRVKTYTMARAETAGMKPERGQQYPLVTRRRLWRNLWIGTRLAYCEHWSFDTASKKASETTTILQPHGSFHDEIATSKDQNYLRSDRRPAIFGAQAVK